MTSPGFLKGLYEREQRSTMLRIVASSWCLTILVSVLLCFAVDANLTELVPVPGATRSLIYRAGGLALALRGPRVSGVKLGANILFDEKVWREHWPDGTAIVYSGRDFSIEGDPPSAAMLDLNNAQAVILVRENATLELRSLTIRDSAPSTGYVPTSTAPYWNERWPFFPSIVLAPGSRVVLMNVSWQYQNPNPLDTCPMYTSRKVFEARQQYPNNTVEVSRDGKAFTILGRIRDDLLKVNDPNNNTLGTVAISTDTFTMTCLDREGDKGGLSPGVMVAVVAVPVLVVLGALVGAFWFFKKRRRARQDRAPAVADVEGGSKKEPLRPIPIGGVEGYDTNEGGLDQQAVSVYPNLAGTFKNSESLPSSYGGVRSINSALDSRSADPPSHPSGVSTDVATCSQFLPGLPSTSSGASRSTPGSAATNYSARVHDQAVLRGAPARNSDGSSPLEPILGESSEGVSRNEIFNSIPSILKARSEHSIFKDLELGPLIGRGSYGKVYKGRWKAAIVAVKIVEYRSGQLSSSNRLNVVRESVLSTAIAHPNVVTTYHISNIHINTSQSMPEGSPDGTTRLVDPARYVQEEDSMSQEDPDSSQDDAVQHATDQMETWLILEYCDRGPLDKAVKAKRFRRRDTGMPDLLSMYKCLLDIISGLDYLHSVGVLHGDLKTANVLLKSTSADPRGFVCKLADFGLSRVMDTDVTHISTRTHGTIAYMPWELLSQGKLTKAVDVYSYAMIMWELYTGEQMFESGVTMGQVFYLIVYQQYRPPVPDHCPVRYRELMEACWRQLPEERLDCGQITKALQELYRQEKAVRKAALRAARSPTATTILTLNSGSNPSGSMLASASTSRGPSSLYGSQAPYDNSFPVASSRLLPSSGLLGSQDMRVPMARVVEDDPRTSSSDQGPAASTSPTPARPPPSPFAISSPFAQQ